MTRMGPAMGPIPFQDLSDDDTDPEWIFGSRDSTPVRDSDEIRAYEAGIQHCLDTVLFLARQLRVKEPELIIRAIKARL